MTVSLLLLTHNGIGQQMLDTLSSIFAEPNLDIELLAIPANLGPESLGGYADLVRSRLEKLESADGTLVLTDLFGATPDNLARYFAAELNSLVVSGLNLPMLIKVHCNRDKTLAELKSIAIEASRRGITSES